MTPPRPRPPELIVFDFDGVMTDNRVLVFADGSEAVFCNRSDGLGFDVLRRVGQRVLILSTETNPIVNARARKLRVPVQSGVRDKAAALGRYCRRRKIDLAAVIYVGNDLNDLAAIRLVGHGICPADAHPRIKRACRTRLQTKGGAGVVRELVERVLGLRYEDGHGTHGASRDNRTGDRATQRGRRP